MRLTHIDLWPPLLTSYAYLIQLGLTLASSTSTKETSSHAKFLPFSVHNGIKTWTKLDDYQNMKRPAEERLKWKALARQPSVAKEDG